MSTPTEPRAPGATATINGSSIVAAIQQMLGDTNSRRAVIAHVRSREQLLIELGMLDIDCQRLHHDEATEEAAEVYQEIVNLEHRLELR